MKYYKISEDKLRELLQNYLELRMIDWEWYGASRRELIKEYIPDADEDTDLSDVATLLLKDYEVVNE